MIKLAEYLPAQPNRLWQLCQQLGVRHAICGLRLADPATDHAQLAAAVRAFAEGGFTLAGLEGDPLDMRRLKFGLPGREEDLARYQALLRSMGELGVPLICLNFMAGIGWHRNRSDVPTRGGALVTRFDLADVPAELTEAGEVSPARIWDNFEWFITRVTPVAEAAGVMLALHPDDPPLERLRGLGRVLWSPDAYRRALTAAPSPALGVTFCQANFKLMGQPLEPLVREWGAAGKLGFVHFRDVTGDVTAFEETFHDAGPTDMAAMLKLYHEVGFDGPLRVDHVPTMAGEDNSAPGYETAGRLFAIGYVKGLLDGQGIPYR